MMGFSHKNSNFKQKRVIYNGFTLYRTLVDPPARKSHRFSFIPTSIVTTASFCTSTRVKGSDISKQKLVHILLVLIGQSSY